MCVSSTNVPTTKAICSRHPSQSESVSQLAEQAPELPGTRRLPSLPPATGTHGVQTGGDSMKEGTCVVDHPIHPVGSGLALAPVRDIYIYISGRCAVILARLPMHLFICSVFGKNSIHTRSLAHSFVLRAKGAKGAKGGRAC